MRVVCRKFARQLSVLTLASLAAAAAVAAPPSASYKLVFADEFTGSSLDTLKWNANYSWGNTHNHSAYMDPSQIKFTGSAMNLQAINTRHPNATDFWHNEFGWQSMNYTSGAVNTSGKFNFNNGYFEATIKQPASLGSWPAFWMLKSGWPPEIDIMEFVHTNNSGSGNTRYRTIANFHYTNNSNANASYYKEHWQGADLTAAYHTYGLEWTSSVMRFYLDGTVIHTVTDTAAIADASQMYLILNHAVGGWAGTPTASNFPGDMLVDSVKVWQLPASTSTTTTWQATTPATTSWDTASNWTVQVPKFEDVTAVFRSNNNAAVSVTWSNSRIVAGLLLDSTTTSYSIGPSTTSALQFAKSASGANGAIDVPSTNTKPHTIAARLELYDSAIITNASAQQLTITGVITGAGNLIFEGTGTTLISNSNTYTGDTYIDAAGQGPAVVRVDRSRPFGTTGTIYFNPAGNGTSGKLEVLGNRDIPNNIVLTGRNNTTPAIVNISGNNTLSGTLSITSGGGNYILQSDSGLLRLTANSSAATPGVAVTSLATGTRTITLQGAGNGSISGVVQNGSASALNVTKLGTGSWTFFSPNTYTGSTTVSAGSLIVSAPLVGTSAVSIADGATMTLSSPLATLATKSLSIAAGGLLNSTNSDIVVDYTGDSIIAVLIGYLTDGRITANPDSAGLPTTLAISEAADLGLTSLGSIPLDDTTVVMKYTYVGDANLDGQVDALDYERVDLAIGNTGVLGTAQGDLNYDANVDALDYEQIDLNIGNGVGAPLANITASVFIPEPAFLASLAVAGFLPGRRQRR